MKVLVAGDFCPQHRVAKLFEEGNFSYVLDDVKGIVKEFDYSVVNFECPVRLGGEVPNLERLSLYCSEKGMEAVQYAGFKCLTLANNHFRDWGDGGIKSTLATSLKLGLDYVGGGHNKTEAGKTLYKKIGNEILAIVNCCEHEFSLATSERGGANPLNIVSQYYAIIEARKNANHVIVIVHGGHEHFQLPSPRMQEAYRFFIDAGADVVINHHQHCISGYEIYNRKPIFYGIGNFCFDFCLDSQKPSDLWNIGFMVGLDFVDGEVKYEIYPYSQCGEEPRIILLKKDILEMEITKLNGIIGDPIRLREEVDKYYDKSMQEVNKLINPITTVRYLSRLYRMGLFPKIITKRWIMYLCNYTMCESHRDKMEYYFEHHIYNK